MAVVTKRVAMILSRQVRYRKKGERMIWGSGEWCMIRYGVGGVGVGYSFQTLYYSTNICMSFQKL